MSEQKRGRGRPRNDGKPNKSTAALIEQQVILGTKKGPALNKGFKAGTEADGDQAVVTNRTIEINQQPVNVPVLPVTEGADKPAAIGPNQAQRIQDAFRQEAELPVFEDRQAPPPLKHVDARKPVSVSISEFLKGLHHR